MEPEKSKPEANNNKDTSDDSKLDPASSDFDPKFAIYSDKDVEGAKEEAKPFNDIEECIKAFNTERREMKNQDNAEIIAGAGPVKYERCFAPEQMMVPTNRGKKFRDVTVRMEAFRAGPLGQLREWKEEKVRVKVWTRALDQIRGYAIGFVAAFDKHWNLALTDVDEQFQRRRTRNTWCPDRKLKRKYLPSDLPIEYKVGTSTIRIVRIKGKFEVCVRHVPQVLLRGEHVVMVAKAP
eukprot:TRINITY_DN4392_c0_g1_i12.p1 TRINITY_DN4392_c0_g1~~TRINITY_DN4392_c0_g1_i12.p1  ORF type:complete len:237 (-),score=51.75 TRINITY_DN4392_c0_g1_i12:821-1531(-)